MQSAGGGVRQRAGREGASAASWPAISSARTAADVGCSAAAARVGRSEAERLHLLGHASLGATDTYLGRPRLEDMLGAVKDATYGIRTNVLAVAQKPQIPLKATTGIEPVQWPSRSVEPNARPHLWGSQWLDMSRV
jgi:hypothetical protein